MPVGTENVEDTLRGVAPVGGMFADRYRLIRVLGRGGMGIVLEAEHLALGRSVALKVLVPALVKDPDVRARFQLEATLGGRIRDAHVVPVIDAGIDSATGAPFLVMELLSGTDVAGVLKNGPATLETAVEWLAQLTRALETVHAAGIVHRDLKPENLFLERSRSGVERLVVLDFGIAKVVASGSAKVTIGLGTPIFMAPEQLHGRSAISAQTDLYAAAHVAFAILVGRPFFAREATDGLSALVTAILGGPRDDATARARLESRALPERFGPWFARATHPDPNQRFASASEQFDELLHATGAAPPASMRPRRSREPAAPNGPRGDAAAEPNWRPAFVGRPNLLRRIDAQLASAEAGTATFTLLTGPIGIGRTRLLEEVLGRGATLTGSVLAFAGSIARPGPLQALRAALVGRSDAARLSAAASAAFAPRPGIVDATDPLEPVLSAFLAWAEDAPRVVVVDDVQDLDPATVRLLSLAAACAARGPRLRFAIVAALRSDLEPRPDVARLVATLAQHPHLDALLHAELGPLADSEVERLSANIARLSPDVVAHVARVSGGVPRFVVQAVRSLFDEGRLSARGGAFVLDEAKVSATIPGVLDRIQRALRFGGDDVDDRAARVLAALSVARAPVPRDALVRGLSRTGVAPNDSASMLARVESVGLIRSDADSFELAEPAVAPALFAELSARPWFRDVAIEVLESLAASGIDGFAAAAADGLLRVGARSAARMAYVAAAEEAFARGDLHAAGDLASRAVPLESRSDPSAAALEVRTRLVLGRALRETASASAAQAAIAHAPSAGVPLALAHELRILQARVMGRRGELDAATQVELVRAVDAGAVVTPRVVARLVVSETARGSRGLEWLNEALTLLDGVPEAERRDLTYRVQNLRLEITWEGRHGGDAACREVAEAARLAASRAGSERARLDMELNLAALDSDGGAHEAAEQRLLAAARDADRRGLAEIARRATASLAGLMLRRDRFADALRFAVRATNESNKRGDGPLERKSQDMMSEALFKLGRFQDARAVADDVVSAYVAASDPNLPLALLRRADILVAQGEASLARLDATRAEQAGRAAGNADHAARASLFVGRLDARSGDAAASAQLERVVAELSAVESSLRPPTLRALVEARTWLASRG